MPGVGWYAGVPPYTAAGLTRCIALASTAILGVALILPVIPAGVRAVIGVPIMTRVEYINGRFDTLYYTEKFQCSKYS